MHKIMQIIIRWDRIIKKIVNNQSNEKFVEFTSKSGAEKFIIDH